MTVPGDDRNIAAAKHFQDTAQGWTDRYIESHRLSHGFLVRRQAVETQLAAIPVHANERALDVGCGTGPYLDMLAKRSKTVVGIDVAPAMIEEAARNLPPGADNVQLRVASVYELPFPDSSFDVGVCVGVLEYFEDPASVLRAAFRVVKPGGSIVFTVPNFFGLYRMTGLPRTATLLFPPRWKIRVGAFLDHLRGRVPDPSKYYLGASFTRGRLRRLCAQTGLEIAVSSTSGYDGLRFLGLPAPARLESAVDRRGEARRLRFPWKHIGNNLIVTIRKPSAR